MSGEKICQNIILILSDSDRKKEIQLYREKMSLIQDYEQQYAILTAEITAQIGRTSHSSGGKE